MTTTTTTPSVIYFGHEEDSHSALPIAAKGNRIRVIIDGKAKKWLNLRTNDLITSSEYTELKEAANSLKGRL